MGRRASILARAAKSVVNHILTKFARQRAQASVGRVPWHFSSCFIDALESRYMMSGDLPTWVSVPDPSAASWNAATSTLTVTGPTTIIANPGSVEPTIVADGPAAQVLVG